MPVLTWISGALLMLHLAHSNVLLKADLGDVNGMMSIAKHLVQVPVFEEINKIWQRASDQVKNQYYKELAKIKSEKQRRPKHKLDTDYEAPAKHGPRSQPKRQFKNRKPKRTSHDRVKANRRQGGVIERLSESISDDRPSQGYVNERPSKGNVDKRHRQEDRPSQDNVDDDVIALGKNASSYLKSINKIFENL